MMIIGCHFFFCVRLQRILLITFLSARLITARLFSEWSWGSWISHLTCNFAIHSTLAVFRFMNIFINKLQTSSLLFFRCLRSEMTIKANNNRNSVTSQSINLLHSARRSRLSAEMFSHPNRCHRLIYDSFSFVRSRLHDLSTCPKTLFRLIKIDYSLCIVI